MASRPQPISPPGSLGDLYENIDQKHVDSITASSDLTKIYYHVDNGPIMRSVSVNPLVAEHILTLADKKEIHTTFVSTAPTDFTAMTINAGLGFLEQLSGLVLASIFIQFIVRAFSRGMPLGGQGGMPSPFSPVGRQNEKENMIKANISLSSWAGSPEIFEECVEIVSYLRNATVYQNAGAEIPKGILLEGPPGTGKTLLAKAIASEADANFISVSASEFVELYVGLGASKVRGLFQQARQNKPAILFIDEIDAIGKQRGGGFASAGGNDEREQTLNQILAEMDGFTNNDGILVIGATNRRDILDAALLRPGRFDRLVNVPLPDRPSRRAILAVHVKNKRTTQDVNLDLIAEATSGFSGAQLKNLLNEAAIYAARSGNSTISQNNIEDSLEKLVVGLVRKVDVRSEEARRRVAIHEIGHAYLAATFPHYFELNKVTIQSTYQGAGGYTLFNEKPDISESGLYTKDLLKCRLIVTMGGKAAETLYYGEDHVSLGAIQDLKQANDLARRMIGNYGMGEDLDVFFDDTANMGATSVSDFTKQVLDCEALSLVKEAYADATFILKNNRDKIDGLIERLLDETSLHSNDFA